MSDPNTGRPRREIDDRLLDSVQARYEENARVILEMVTGIIGDGDPVGDDGWDQAAEDRMIARWEASSRKTSSDKVGTRRNNDDPLREVWRFCLRFLKETLPIMLSSINGLQFMPARMPPRPAGPARQRDIALSSDLFTLSACGTLSKLVVHPLWYGDYHIFLDALKFAALCRVDAKANIVSSLRWPAHCPVIQGLNARLIEGTGSVLPDTLQNLHLAARGAASGSEVRESVFSEVLFRIGLTAVAESPWKAEKTQLRQGIIPFQGKDLDVIKNAIDELASTDDRVQFSIEEVYIAFKSVGTRGEIPSREQLQSLDARACKQLSEEGTTSSRIPEETEEANRSTASSQRRGRSRSPLAQGPDQFPFRLRSRLRSPHLNESHQGSRPLEQRRSSSHAFSSSRHSNPGNQGRHSQRVDSDNTSPARQTLGDNAYSSIRGSYMPEGSELTRSQALSPDEIGEVRRELNRLGEQLRAGETERDRLIEQVSTQQAETHNLLNHRHADAIQALKGDYEDKLETLRSEHAEAIATLKSEHAEAVATLKSEHAATIASLKTEIRNGLQGVMSSSLK
ncbi:hypothetical protein FPANT_2434 [Fusarium pseudoanthophilum]|uniref:Uncharacterized protein n=1 Tax=Fusarium pseudoanthophilum TaxID=48495 RepID=A0A8H5PPR7_9HYPO|nr:hypothetical protein FPANT_2434 [Fusarium pseudoanthophilum]